MASWFGPEAPGSLSKAWEEALTMARDWDAALESAPTIGQEVGPEEPEGERREVYDLTAGEVAAAVQAIEYFTASMYALRHRTDSYGCCIFCSAPGIREAANDKAERHESDCGVPHMPAALEALNGGG